jgi:hypothetical protein
MVILVAITRRVQSIRAMLSFLLHQWTDLCEGCGSSGMEWH